MRFCAIIIISSLFASTLFAQKVEQYKNQWSNAPKLIPNIGPVDSPLLGNGDITMTVKYNEGKLSYYFSKNDFWRLQSLAPGFSGPRVVAILEFSINGFNQATFTGEQSLSNGNTVCKLTQNGSSVIIESLVLATENIASFKISSESKTPSVTYSLKTPENKSALVNSGREGETEWLTRSFEKDVEIATKVAIAVKTLPSINSTDKNIIVAIESAFKSKDPLKHVLAKTKKTTFKKLDNLLLAHNNWWGEYWNKSLVSIDDDVLMKSYYQGLYTMGACSRDPKFPPGLFGWTTTDNPNWEGDYHLNYNYVAPFYALYTTNRLEQAEPQDQPLLDFIPRGKWYASEVTKTRGVLFPVGIGPLGIETTRNHAVHLNTSDLEKGGLFLHQRSNSAYSLVNIAQQWRCTYDKAYAKKIYPLVIEVVDFWEDYLKYEDGRYVVYNDAIHESSGHDKNPILTLGLLNNAFNLVLELSEELNIDLNRQEKWEDILAKLSSFPTQEKDGKTVFRYTEGVTAWWPDNGLGIQHIYPASAITLSSNPELIDISKNTIAAMRRWSDGNTSNSFFMAAIRVGYDENEILTELRKYAQHTYPNGFQKGNPHGIENSATVANALNEMLCMSAGGEIRLFPVFPKNRSASFSQIRAWGAFLVSAKQSNGMVSDVKIVSEKGKLCTIQNPWYLKKVQVVRNNKQAEVLSGEKISIPTSKGEVIELLPVL